MRIYKEEEKSKEIFKNYKYIFSLKNFFLIPFFLIIIAFLFAPLGLSRSDKYYIRKSAKYLSNSLKIFNKQYSLLASEIFQSTDNLFGISTRYFKSFSNQKDELSDEDIPNIWEIPIEEPEFADLEKDFFDGEEDSLPQKSQRDLEIDTEEKVIKNASFDADEANNIIIISKISENVRMRVKKLLLN